VGLLSYSQLLEDTPQKDDSQFRSNDGKRRGKKRSMNPRLPTQPSLTPNGSRDKSGNSSFQTSFQKEKKKGHFTFVSLLLLRLSAVRPACSIWRLVVILPPLSTVLKLTSTVTLTFTLTGVSWHEYQGIVSSTKWKLSIISNMILRVTANHVMIHLFAFLVGLWCPWASMR